MDEIILGYLKPDDTSLSIDFASGIVGIAAYFKISFT
jgi:hypothetical protein